MHGSGIEVDDTFTTEWSQLGAKVASLKITIADEKFRIVSQIATTGSWNNDWEAMVATLAAEPKECCYNVIRSETDQTKFVFVPFVPDRAAVRKKMLFASSQGALKAGMGSAKFEKDFYVTTPGECGLDEYRASLAAAEGQEVMTFDEQQAYDSHMESHMAMGDTSTQAIVGVPIDLSDDLLKAIKAINSSNCTVVMGVEGNGEVLQCIDASNDTLDKAASKLPGDQPRYILHEFTASSGDKSLVFIYYCPSKAKPRARMFYSTCKSNVLLVFDKLGLEEPKRIECDSPSEISQEEIQNTLFPPIEVKEKMSKPKARTKAKFRGAKFNADA